MIKTQDEIKTMIHNGNCRNSDKLGKPLSDKELEIVQLMINGITLTEDISTSLNISTQTTRNHIYNICDKLELYDRAAIIAYAYQVSIVMDKILSLSIGGK